MIELVMTSESNPEQYNAVIRDINVVNGVIVSVDEQIGYLRLRHGIFRVDAPKCGGEIVFQARPNGFNSFEDDERDYYLRFAVDAVLRHMDGLPKLLPCPPAPEAEYVIRAR